LGILGIFLLVPEVRGKQQIFLVFFAVGVFDEAETGCETRLANTRGVLFVAEPPRQSENSWEKDNSTEGNEAGPQWVDEIGLAEVDEPVQDGDDIVNAEY
jgi:hypothetical protein